MKRFFRNDCIINACGLSAFVLISIYLILAWQLIGTGSLIAQLLVSVFLLYFIVSSLLGVVFVAMDVIRKLREKRKKSMTERDLDK